MLNANSGTCALLAAVVSVGAYHHLSKEPDASAREDIVAVAVPTSSPVSPLAADATIHLTRDDLSLADHPTHELAAFVDHWEP